MVILVSIAKIVVIISCRNWGGAGAGAGSDVWKRERRLSLHFLVILSKGGKQGTGDGQEFFFNPTCVKRATSYLLFVHGMNFGGVSIY